MAWLGLCACYADADAIGVLPPRGASGGGSGGLLEGAETGMPARCEPTVRILESLDRGVVSVAHADGVLVSWRLFADDAPDRGFDVVRDGVRVNAEPITDRTNFLDPQGTLGASYQVVPLGGDAPEAPASGLGVWAQTYLSVPMQTLEGHVPNDGSVGDLDGDGRYEIILKQEQQPLDPAEEGPTGQTKLEAYALDGTLLWRIDLGRNVREGPHYTPFVVYDLDSDGFAEVVVKTSDGSVDGRGQVIGTAEADYRNEDGRVLTGPEYLSVFDGQTGAILVSHPFEPARGEVASWGDEYGNRVDRLFMGVAYLDGIHPSLLTVRGLYDRIAIAAWTWQEGELHHEWTFDTADPAVPSEYQGQGNHHIATGDIDGDGRDEVLYGGIVLDDDGMPLYSMSLGVGRVMHVGDLDPTLPGLEIFNGLDFGGASAAHLRQAQDGQLLWAQAADPDAGGGPVRAMAADIVPESLGEEFWVAGAGLDGMIWNAQGEVVAMDPPSVNFGVWWDGDRSRELLDDIRIEKFGSGELVVAEGCASNNLSLATPVLVADILGDWREEVIWRTEDSRALRIYVTPEPSDVRIPTLMHDPAYRMDVATQNVGINRPPHPSQYLGTGMSPWMAVPIAFPCDPSLE